MASTLSPHSPGAAVAPGSPPAAPPPPAWLSTPFLLADVAVVASNFQGTSRIVNDILGFLKLLDGRLAGVEALSALFDPRALNDMLTAIERMRTDLMRCTDAQKADHTAIVDLRETSEAQWSSQALELAALKSAVKTLEQRNTDVYDPLVKQVKELAVNLASCESNVDVLQAGAVRTNARVDDLEARVLLLEKGQSEMRREMAGMEQRLREELLAAKVELREYTKDAVDTLDRSVGGRLADLESRLNQSLSDMKAAWEKAVQEQAAALQKLVAVLDDREHRDYEELRARLDAQAAAWTKAMSDLRRSLLALNAGQGTSSGGGDHGVGRVDEGPLIRKGCLSCDFTTAVEPPDRRPAQQRPRLATSGFAPGAVLRFRQGLPSSAAKAPTTSSTAAALAHNRPSSASKSTGAAAGALMDTSGGGGDTGSEIGQWGIELDSHHAHHHHHAPHTTGSSGGRDDDDDGLSPPVDDVELAAVGTPAKKSAQKEGGGGAARPTSAAPSRGSSGVLLHRQTTALPVHP